MCPCLLKLHFSLMKWNFLVSQWNARRIYKVKMVNALQDDGNSLDKMYINARISFYLSSISCKERLTFTLLIFIPSFNIFPNVPHWFWTYSDKINNFVTSKDQYQHISIYGNGNIEDIFTEHSTLSQLSVWQ